MNDEYDEALANTSDEEFDAVMQTCRDMGDMSEENVLQQALAVVGDTSGTPAGTATQGSDQGRGQRGQQGQPRRTSWTANQLMQTTFPPARFAVPGVIAEGVNLFAGSPKIGKSWCGLNLSLAVATGGRAFDSIPVDAGDVLYLALEDTGRRLQTRLRKMLGGRPAPDRLTLTTACEPFPAGAVSIRKWLDTHPDARMVVIDVFAKLRGSTAPGVSAYDADYRAVGHAKRIADDYGIAVVLVHHVRKAAAEDFLGEVSGTNGISGAADAVLVLKRSRGDADAVLHVTGRDVEEAELALRFDADRGTWTALPGPAIDHMLDETRASILTHLRGHPGRTPKQVADGTGLNYEAVKKTCRRMADDGQLSSDGRGHYTPVPAVPAVPVAGQRPCGAVPGLSLVVPDEEEEPS